MTIYIILLLVSLVLLYERDRFIYLNIYCRRFLLSVMVLFLFGMEMFRSLHVGVDYKMYYTFFKLSSYEDMRLMYVEPAYAYLTTIAQHFHLFYILSFFVLFIGIISLYALNTQFRVNKFALLSFFVLTGFYFQSFDILRQFIAISFLGIGIYLFFKFYSHHVLKYILFFILLIIAYEFHHSAIIGILLLLLPKIHCSKRTVILSSIITLICAMSSKINHLVHNLSFVIFPSYFSKYGNVVTSKDSIGASTSIGEIIIKLIPVLFQLIILYFFVSRNNNLENSKIKFILSGYLLYLLFSILITFWGSWLRRIQLYLLIFPIFYSCIYMDEIHFKLAINSILDNNKINCTHSYLFNKILFVLMWIVTYIMKLVIDNEKIVPYNFV